MQKMKKTKLFENLKHQILKDQSIPKESDILTNISVLSA